MQTFESLERWSRRIFGVAICCMFLLAITASVQLYLVVDYFRAKQALAEASRQIQADLKPIGKQPF